MIIILILLLLIELFIVCACILASKCDDELEKENKNE